MSETSRQETESTARKFVFPTAGRTAGVLVAILVLFTVVIGFALRSFAALTSRSSGWQLAFLGVAVLVGESLLVGVTLRVAGWQWRSLRIGLALPRRAWALAVVWVGSLLAGIGAVAIDRHFAGPSELELLGELLASDPGTLLALGFVIVVASPVFEEYLMRGIVLRALALNCGAGLAVAVSAMSFSAIHLNRAQAPYALVYGVVWALVVLRTGSLGATVLLHAAGNSVAMLALLVARGLASIGDEGSAVVPPLWSAVLLTLGGAVLIGLGLFCLPKDIPRLAAFWGLDGEAAGSVAELRLRAMALRGARPVVSPPALPDVRCPICFEMTRADTPVCWHCGRSRESFRDDVTP